MGIMINRRRVYGGKKGLLPSGYKQLEYIENTSNAYIDTGVKYYNANSTEVILNGEFTNKASNLSQFICMIGGSNKHCWFGNYTSKYYCYGQSNTFYNTNMPLTAKRPISATIKGNKFTIKNSERQFSGSNTTNTVCDGINLPLGARYGERGNLISVALCILYNVKIVINDVLTRDFIPCKNPQNIVGMYDIVNGVFYSSPDGTAFVAGPEV